MDVFAGNDDFIKVRDWAVKASPSYKSRLGAVSISLLMLQMTRDVGVMHFDLLSNMICQFDTNVS